MQIETERKFLISYPDTDILLSQKEVEIKEIVQTYLLSEKDVTDRVRKVISNGVETYIRTQKKRISHLSCFEDEKIITYDEYEKLLEKADRNLSVIIKTRYVFPYKEHIIEIDVYPFWDDRAILEIELKEENEVFGIPEFISVIKEVTDDKRYKNSRLARDIPNDVI
ncbi:MAG: hypothetical protein E7621_07135 [Ruminococcaceae bacterium]|nr:hypothetical protein [Oscillospiraceae bacterium]